MAHSNAKIFLKCELVMLPDRRQCKKVIAWNGDFGMDQYVLWFSFCLIYYYLRLVYLQNNWIFLSMTSFHLATWKHHHQSMNMTIQLATKHQWKTLRSLEERFMASPEPSGRPSRLGWITLLSTEMWENTTCHIFGTKFCSPPQNSKLNNTPLHLNICGLKVKQLLVTYI